MDSNYAVYCGIDVGKGEHHAVGLTAAGKKIYDKALPNDEAKLRAVFDRLASHGSVLVVVDQPNTIGTPDRRKQTPETRSSSPFAARTMPHTLRRVDTGDEALAELEVLVGFDDDLAGEATRVS